MIENGMSNRISSDRVLVIAPHADDETLGVGGAMLRHKNRGDKLACIFVTVPVIAAGFNEDFIEARKKELQKVKEAYTLDKMYELNFPTTKLTSLDVPSLVKKISDVFNDFKPNIVYLPFRHDIHTDHKIIFEAAFSCTKIFRYPFVHKIMMYETTSETDFSLETFAPNYFIDISDYMNKKMDVLKIYASQMGEHPFPRSYSNVEAWAKVRGAQAGVRYAEAFQLIKEIES